MAREIIHSQRFESELAEIEPDKRRADELILSGPAWVISRKPRAGRKVGATDIWCIICLDNPKRRELSVFYRFTDETVELVSVTSAEI